LHLVVALFKHILAQVLAPLFVFCELLFMLGLFPEMSKRLQSITDKNVAAWRAQKQK
jgi:uncharacterized membrane protein YGL010W